MAKWRRRDRVTQDLGDAGLKHNWYLRKSVFASPGYCPQGAK